MLDYIRTEDIMVYTKILKGRIDRIQDEIETISGDVQTLDTKIKELDSSYIIMPYETMEEIEEKYNYIISVMYPKHKDDKDMMYLLRSVGSRILHIHSLLEQKQKVQNDLDYPFRYFNNTKAIYRNRSNQYGLVLKDKVLEYANEEIGYEDVPIEYNISSSETVDDWIKENFPTYISRLLGLYV